MIKNKLNFRYQMIFFSFSLSKPMHVDKLHWQKWWYVWLLWFFIPILKRETFFIENWNDGTNTFEISMFTLASALFCNLYIYIFYTHFNWFSFDIDMALPVYILLFPNKFQYNQKRTQVYIEFIHSFYVTCHTLLLVIFHSFQQSRPNQQNHISFQWTYAHHITIIIIIIVIIVIK